MPGIALRTEHRRDTQTMTLLAVERIKLFSTRSSWWSIVVALGLTIGFATMMATQTGPEFPLSLGMTQAGHQFGLIVIMVMATLTVTTEYRFGTIRATFQAVPNRTAVMLSKTAIVSGLALLIGEVGAFGSWAAAKIVAPEADIAISSAADWRQVAGTGLVFAGGAVLAVAVGSLIRQTAGAVSLLMIWTFLVESLIALVPKIGSDIQQWMPFVSANRFLSGSAGAEAPLGPWASLVYFLALAVAMWIIAVITVQRRDA